MDLELDLVLGFNDYNKPKKIDSNSHKRNSFLGLSIPLHMHEHRSYDGSCSSFKIMGQDVMKQGVSESKEDDDDESKYSMDFRCRKKLRLSRDQITLLEDSFKQQTTLNTVQKHTLAEKLHLKPRQVEVWFQNRRARTKLKQTEVDCEFLRRNCERLSEENWRLKKELLELRSSMKMERPPAAAAEPHFLHHNHAAAAAAAHEKNRGGGEKNEGAIEVVHISPINEKPNDQRKRLE